MNILIAGGTGFIGKYLIESFLHDDHEVFALTRSPSHQANHPHLHYITWLQQNKTEIDLSELPKIDCIINLAGDPINKGRWTKKKKERILTSRRTTTKELINMIKKLKTKPKLFINASAIGVYGYSTEKQFTEESKPLGNSFPAKVCKQWEQDASQAKEEGIRTVIARIGIVLGKDGGALPRMALPYKFFIGGKVASGHQWISWIHIKDVVKLFHFIILNEEISGPINFTAPNPVKMNTLGKEIGQVLKKPHWIPVPSFALKMIFGEMSEFLIEGQYVIPKKALDYHYKFQYETVDKALKEIYFKS